MREQKFWNISKNIIEKINQKIILLHFFRHLPAESYCSPSGHGIGDAIIIWGYGA